MKITVINTPEVLSTNPMFLGLVETPDSSHATYHHENGYIVSAKTIPDLGTVEVAVFDKKAQFTQEFFNGETYDNVIKTNAAEVERINNVVGALK